MSRKFIEVLHILALLMHIVEDIYKGDLVVHIGVYVCVIIKALMKFDTRHIAKTLNLIRGGSSFFSVNMVQALPNTCHMVLKCFSRAGLYETKPYTV